MLASLRRFWQRLKTGAVLIEGDRKLYLEGRDGYRYEEGGRIAFVQSEMLTGPVNELIYAGAITQWMPPYDHEELTEAKRREIADMVQRFLESSGLKVEIDWGQRRDTANDKGGTG